MTADQLRAIDPCEHDWKRKHDWEGDPGVIGGVNSFTYLECSICGEQIEDDGSYVDYEDDYLYD